jgi:hypothetical protein
MFDRLRNPRGGFTGLMTGLALMALSGFVLLLPLPRGLAVVLAGAVFLAGAASILSWRRARQEDRYDLRRLWDEPPPEPEEPYEDTVPEGDEAAPYCGWCDEAYAPGTRRCHRCGRELG